MDKKTTKSRAWLVTVHIANMQKMELKKEEYEKPEVLANYLVDTWKNSGIERVSEVAVCLSAKGLYHCHMAVYTKSPTTLQHVTKVLFDSHVEVQRGSKAQVKAYMEKANNEKGEDVLYITSMEHIQDNQGKRNDFEEIKEYLDLGYTPNQIFREHMEYRKYERMIKSEFMARKIESFPIVKEMNNEWHVGESGSGKSWYLNLLAKKYSRENIYVANDYSNGGLDLYVEQGAPPILFMDELKDQIKYSTLLSMLDVYSCSQTHCRYANTYNLWTTTIITSVFPPEEVYNMIVSGKKNIDSLQQLIRRLNKIVYHYIEDGVYKIYSMPASEYIDYKDLIRRAKKEYRGEYGGEWFDVNDSGAECPFL